MAEPPPKGGPGGSRLEGSGNETGARTPSGERRRYEVCLGAERDRTPAFEAWDLPVTWTAGSRTVPPRHTRRAA